MRVRRANALIVVFRDTRPVVLNFLSQQVLTCNAQALDILAHAADWCSFEALFARLKQFEPQSVAGELLALVEHDALLVEGSLAAERDATYAATWDWGEAAGLYHFGLKYTRFVAPSTLTDWFLMRGEQRPPPHLFATNAQYAMNLPLPTPLGGLHVFDVMRKRRSVRQYGAHPLTIQQLGDCLFAGFGITGFLEDPLTGRLPLSMTPSGGARNPYEGYLYVRHVAGLESGLYHYAAIDHTLGRLPVTMLPTIALLLSGQEWADSAAVVIFLVARFERTMWKYAHPSAYRVMLIEAGHIAQNILLAASAHELAAAPTAALNDRVADHAFGLEELAESVVYAIVLGSSVDTSAYQGVHDDITSREYP